MLTVIGCTLIIITCTAAGFLYGDNFRKRNLQLKEIQRALNQLQNEILYTYTALPKAILNVSKKSIFPIDRILYDIHLQLLNNEVEDTYDAFIRAFKKYKDYINLKDEDINIIFDLSKTLGESDVDGQRRMFQIALDNIKNQIIDSETSMNKNVKMYRCLGFSIGAMIIIVLIWQDIAINNCYAENRK